MIFGPKSRSSVGHDDTPSLEEQQEKKYRIKQYERQKKYFDIDQVI